MITSASRTPSRRSWCTSPQAAASAGSSVGGPTRRTRAPSARRACTFERATRLCRMSPTIATVRSSRRLDVSRMVSRSSSAWVGCSCAPSPALMTGQSMRCGQEVRRARGVVADDQAVGAHGGDVARRIEQRLALGAAAGRRSDADVVGAQALGGDLERRARARAGLVEEADDRLAAQRRHLLDVALGDLLEGVGGVDQEEDLVARQSLEAQQVLVGECHLSPPLRDEHDFVAPVPLREPYLNRFADRRGQILADVVGANRQLPMSAVDQHGELHAARPAEVHQRVERGAHRAPGVEHVVDQHDLAVVERKADVGALHLRLLRRARQIVAVERDVDDAARHARRLRWPRPWRPAARRCRRRASGCR